jgi:catechol 2,3-dioxygenase-like lactoylglutathione lyase family enzyme
MLKNAPIVPYIPVADVDRARKFYEEKVGLKPREEYAGGVIYECGNGSWVVMYPSPGAGTSKASTAFWQVDDVVAEVAELKARGVAFEEYDIPGDQDGEQYRERRWRKDRLVQRYRGQYLGCESKGLILRFGFLTQSCWASI